MKIVNKVGIGSSSVATLSHKGVELKWNTSLVTSASTGGGVDDLAHDVFREINQFWATLPEARQDQIFDLYQNIKEVLTSSPDATTTSRRLMPLVGQLCDLHSLEDIKFWMDFKSDIRIPSDLKDRFIEGGTQPGTAERTYVREDYRWLVVMSISLRPMILVWSDFVQETKDSYGTLWKEYYAFQLLSMAKVYHSEPMERLRVYVEASLPQEKALTSAIMGGYSGGISSEDFPTWVLALLVVRRVVLSDIRGHDDSPMLVRHMYHFIIQKVKGHDTTFGGAVRDKTQDGGNSANEENNLSKLEGYKTRQEMSAGDLSYIEHYLKDPYAVAQRIAPDIDKVLLDQSLLSVQALMGHRIWDAQRTIVQWVLKPAIPPRGVEHMPKPTLLKAIAITQALLWQRGYREMAALVSAINVAIDEEMEYLGVESRGRIPRELVERLDELYPYARTSSGKKPPKSAGIVAIESLEKQFSDHEWRLTLPRDWLAGFLQNPNNNRYSVPHEIKARMAHLVVAIAERKL